MTRSRTRRLGIGALALAVVVIAAACQATPGDFTGDAKADPVTYDFSTGQWHLAGRADPLYTGTATDVPVPGDYNGDGKWEPAVLRGRAWVSSALTDPIVYDPPDMPAGPTPEPAGMNGFAPPPVLPVPGDYDGTGKTIPAYYDQVDATWWIMGHATPVQFGMPPVAGGNLGWDVPVPADYDGDHKTDIAVYRPTNGSFLFLSSRQKNKKIRIQLGHPGFWPVPADYDGVGHAQAAVVSGDLSQWWVDGHAISIADLSNDADLLLPAPGDYFGDGHADPALFDQTKGQWIIAGGGGTAATSQALETVPTEMPDAFLVNVVRLTLFGQCLAGGTTQPEFCAPNPRGGD